MNDLKFSIVIAANIGFICGVVIGGIVAPRIVTKTLEKFFEEDE